MTACRPLTGVLFDWDGTLLNSYHADSQAYLGMFRNLGLSWGLKELEEHYSPDWYSVYRAAGIREEQWNRANNLWRIHYAKHPSKLITGARQVLRRLGKRHTLGLVTSGDRARVTRQLREFAPLLMALQKLKLQPSDCIYVGDTPEDLEMARAVAMRAIAVLGPFPTEKRLRAAKPEFLLKKLADLPGLLETLNGKPKRL
jgi:HAD superfamily hydrolase (TIGR01509 family)